MAASFCPPTPPSTKFTSLQPQHYILDKQCTTMNDLRKIHAHLVKNGSVHHVLASSRILAFSASPAGDINYAYLFFTRILNPNLFAWNTIIRGFSRSSTPQYAIFLFIHMLLFSSIQPHRLTYPSVFKAYAQLGIAHHGAQLHGRVIKMGLETDHFIRNTILFMYANCGSLNEAWRLFDEDMESEVVAWNSMIMGLAKCGEIDESKKLFDKMSQRNGVSWNSMISGYVRNGKYMEALELFQEMQDRKIRPSEFTMVSLLNACAGLCALTQGKWIHDYLRKNKFELNDIVVTAIIDMYCKCGCVAMASQVFKSAPKKPLSCWNSMILGLANSGCEEEAIQLFSKLESCGLEPDHVSFIGVLTACSHSWMVDKAREYFSLTMGRFNIKPSMRHYNCMVHVLCRAGLLEEAEDFITSMPIKPDAIIWGSLLSACRQHGDIEMAKRVSKHVIQLNPNEGSGHLLMSNIYATTKQFNEVIEQRILMKEKQIEKEPGCSLIEVDGEVHEFVSGGRLHPKAKEIYLLLNDFK